MKLTKEQEKIVCRAFMSAMARKLYRDGDIDIHKLNDLTMKIEKLLVRSGECRKSGNRPVNTKPAAKEDR